MKRILLIMTAIFCLGSCTYRQYADAEYPETLLYLPAALDGILEINGAAAPENFVGTGNKSLCELDESGRKLIIHLAVVQSGVKLRNCTVQLVSSKSTVNRMIDDGTLPVGVLPLPEAAFNLPEEVSLKGGSAPFDLTVNASYLKDPEFLGKKFATAVKISCDEVRTNPDLETAVVLIDPSFLNN